ncbi:MAG: putative toxin-antitoxin system toxin component, PIN family [Pseudanabaena sp.]|jgi:putative PIN family toxin of toxin-antitoxin system
MNIRSLQALNPPPRIVIDTNLILSALIFGGKTARIRLSWQENLIYPLASKDTITELIRVLAYPKFKLTTSEQEDLLADYLPFCDTVQMTEKPVVNCECRDPKDRMFLELAIAGNADYLITGDQDLLCLAHDFNCPILTIEQFYQIIGG